MVTRDYFNSRRLMEIGPEFPVRIYTEKGGTRRLIREPPSPICFYTTQHRIPIVRRVPSPSGRYSATATWIR